MRELSPGQRRAGRYVDTARAARGWSQRQLADQAGVDTGTVGDLINGKRWPIAVKRAKIEGALDFPPGMIAAVASDEDVTTPAQLPPDILDRLARADPATLTAIRAVLDATDDQRRKPA